MTNVPASTKRCSMCGRDLPVSEYYPRKDRPGQYLAGCRPCRAEVGSARHREQYIPHPRPPLPPEKPCGRCKAVLPLSAFPRRSDGFRGVRALCFECKRAEKREYNETHREQRSVSGREYYAANKDAVIERIRAFRLANPDKYRQIHSDWKKRNPSAMRAMAHRRYAHERGSGGSWTADDWERLKARYDWRCLGCGLQEMTDGISLCFDHVVPLSLGGFNIISNAQPLCKSCNSAKYLRLLDYRLNPYSIP
jgi:5-methylcytosine-specific restriction endonuclease McrA